jgi:DNA-directed RNA polymerase subunit RPC12/RpoP/16S rRNA G966 N2-methylase RsmD
VKSKQQFVSTSSLLSKKSSANPEGYFSGDKPNQNLRGFVEKYGHRFSPDEDSVRKDFSARLEGNRHSALYNFLGFSSKKPYEPIEHYVRHFTKPGDVLLDPFSGSGGLGIVSSKCGRHCILIDASPSATLISKAYCTSVPTDEISIAIVAIQNNLKALELELYETECHLSRKKVIMDAAIWSQTYRCIKCVRLVPLASTGEGNRCPHCGEKITTRQQRFGYVPWGILYKSPSTGEHLMRTVDGPDKKSKEAFEKFDKPKLIHQVWEPKQIGFLDRPMMNHEEPNSPWGVLWRPYHENIRTVGDFFTKRNLFAIQSILNEIGKISASPDVKDLLRLALANIVPSASRQQRYYPGSTFPDMVMPGVLYVPPINEEINVFRRFFAKRRSLLRGQEAVNETVDGGAVIISTQDSKELSDIPGNSIDYVFTDPPYSGRIQYGELGFLEEAILGMDTSWLQNEIIVNEVRNFSTVTWQERLLIVMREVYRVLKPGRWASVCFHDSDPASWERLQDVMLMAGFVPGISNEASSMQTGWQTLKMHTSEDITKRDLVVNYRKPQASERLEGVRIAEDAGPKTVVDRVRSIVREVLETTPGQTKDRIYDEVVSRMVRGGVMEAHDFDQVLGQVATPEGEATQKNRRWYLKGTEFETIDPAESAKEDGAAQHIRKFIEKLLRENPEKEGVHYGDIFEEYVVAVKDQPRRLLTEWLLDYFYKTHDGTYRPPASEEEERLKAEGRAKGVNRRIKRFAAYLEQAVPVPVSDRPNDSTLAEWIRNCKRSGLYEQGKLLYEKGGLNIENLPEQFQVGVEEDYQVCVRMLVRVDAAPAKTAKGKRKKPQ